MSVEICKDTGWRYRQYVTTIDSVPIDTNANGDQDVNTELSAS